MWNDKENKLEEVWFIGGGTEIFTFSIKDKDDQPLYISNCQIKWTLSHLGQNETPIIIKDNSNIGGVTFIDNYTCRVEINSEDTLQLYSNKYEHELIIVQPSGRVLRPSYGYIVIRKGSEY